MTRAGPMALALAAALSVAPDRTLAQVAEPSDYRQDNYRAAVPATLSGARVITTDEAHALWQSGKAAFVDVLPRPPRPANLPQGTIWREAPHLSIPGAIWLPNVGYGELAETMETYFRDGLDRAIASDPEKAVVIFCRADCWMSWNAARRAVEFGFANVTWFPDGTDGWEERGYPTEELTPLPGGS